MVKPICGGACERSCGVSDKPRRQRTGLGSEDRRPALTKSRDRERVRPIRALPT